MKSPRNGKLILGDMSTVFSRKCGDDDETEDILKKNNVFCNIVVTNTNVKKYNVFLNEAIRESFYYNNLLDLLCNATEDDVIHVHFNNGGGYIHTACQLVAAFLKTSAHTIGHLDASASSAASMIFMAMKEFEISSFAEMLCHYYSSSVYGKGNEVETLTDFQKKHLRNVFTIIYDGFLTDDELQRMFKGEDFIFNGNDIKKRLEKKMEAMSNKFKNKKKKLKNDRK